MFKIYRMWKLVKIIESYHITATKGEAPLTKQVMTDMKGTSTKRNDANKLTAALMMGKDRGYFNITDENSLLSTSRINITAKGLEFTSFTSLLNSFSESIDKVGSLLAVVISLFALCISIYK